MRFRVVPRRRVDVVISLIVGQTQDHLRGIEMAFDKPMRHFLRFPRFGQHGGDGDIAREVQQVVHDMGVSGIEKRCAVHDEVIAVDFRCEFRAGSGLQSLGALLHGRNCSLQHDLDLLRIRRPQTEGDGMVGVDFGRD